ncbi:MAG: glycosyl transferase [Nitrospira sp.]
MVSTFYASGPLRQGLESTGVPVISLEKHSRWDVFGFFFRLIWLLRRSRPAVLHAYLSTANVLGVVVKPFVPPMKIVWGLRASNVDLSQYGFLHKLQFWIECRLSRFVDLIIVNSMAGRDYAASRGFPSGKMVVIHNGIDVERFHPDSVARDRIRKAWKVTPQEMLIGLIGRLDPMKGHAHFLHAAALLVHDRYDVRFVCVGNGSQMYRDSLQALCKGLEIDKRVMWFESSYQISEIYNALDIATSSSIFGEGFPNVVAEAMACSVPCVVTDIGDSGWVVGGTGEVVERKNPSELAKGWTRLLDRLVREPDLGARARARIVEHFQHDRLVERTSAVLAELLRDSRSS